MSQVWRYTQWCDLYGVHKVITIYDHCDFDLCPWPWKSIGIILSSCTICVRSLIKIHLIVWSLWCSQDYFHIWQLWPLTPTLKINRDHPLITRKEDTWNAVVSILFTKSWCDGHTYGCMEPRKRYYIPVTMGATIRDKFLDRPTRRSDASLLSARVFQGTLGTSEHIFVNGIYVLWLQIVLQQGNHMHNIQVLPRGVQWISNNET